MLTRRKCVCVLMFLFFIGMGLECSAIGVRPLLLHLHTRPGQTETFTLILTPQDVERRVALCLYETRQCTSGALTYIEGDAEIYPPVDWIDVPQNITVPPGEEKAVQGIVEVPTDAGGSHTLALMVEPVLEGVEEGVALQVRYAVRLIIDVDRPGLRSQVEVLDLDLQGDAGGAPQIKAHIANTSPLGYRVSGEVTIRDAGRRLLERVELSTEIQARNEQRDFRLYPQAEVLLTGQVTEPLFPGTYELRLFLRYDNGRQIIERQEVEVAVGEYQQESELQLLSLEPEEIQVALQPGGVMSRPFQVVNRSGEELQIEMRAQAADLHADHSLFDHASVEIRGDEKTTLAPHRGERYVLTMRALRDMEYGGYYGNLHIEVLNPREGVREYHTIPLSLLVGEGWEEKVDILGVEYDSFHGQMLFSVLIKNLSRGPVQPQGHISIKNQKGVLVQTLSLELQEGTEALLPQQSGLLLGEMKALDSGVYTLSIRLLSQDRELAVLEKTLKIQ